MWSHQKWVEHKDHPPLPAENGLPSTAFFATRVHYWLLFNFFVHQDAQGLFCKATSQKFCCPHLYWCTGLFFTRRSTLHMLLLNLMRSLLAYFSSLSRSIWVAAEPFDVSIISAHFAFSTDLLRVHSALLSRSRVTVLAPVLTLRYTTRDWSPAGLLAAVTTSWAWQSSYFSVHLPVHLPNAYFISSAGFGNHKLQKDQVLLNSVSSSIYLLILTAC